LFGKNSAMLLWTSTRAMAEAKDRPRMDASSARMLALLALSGAAAAALLPGGPLRVPTSPEGMIADAARCVAAARDAGQRRLLVRIVVPQLDTVQPEDLDPWPGGLAQQYPYALDLARRLLCATVGCAPSQVCGSVVGAEGVLGKRQLSL
jgi:hypothetical protein